MKKKWVAFIFPILGLVVISVYLNFALKGITFSAIVNLILAVSIGPVVIWGASEIYEELSIRYQGIILRLGTTFLIIAFSFFVLMVVVQQAIFISFNDFINNASDTETQDSFKLILKGVNMIQLGMDVAFDIFYSLGLIFVSSVMLKLQDFGKYIGIFGIISGALLLIFNLVTFPMPPAESGLFDVGPITAIWWLSILAFGIYEESKKEKI